MNDLQISLADFDSKLKENIARQTVKKATVNPRHVTEKVSVTAHSDKFIKVSFDLYRTDPNYVEDREFWKISEDGENFVRVFTEDVSSPAHTNVTAWTVVNDSSRLALAYKGATIAVLPLDQFKISTANDLVNLRGTLIRKASTDPNFGIRAMQEFSPDREMFIRNEYPELFTNQDS